MAKRKKKKKLTLWGQVKQLLRTRILSGFLLIVPLGITVFVINFLYEFTVGRITPVTERFFGHLPSFTVPVISIFLFAGVLYGVGIIATAVVGRRLIGLAESIIQRIPLVATIYGASKQIVETVSFQDTGSNMKAAVFIEFPCKGMKAIGFLTGKMKTSDGCEFYKVFVPTTPNISVGLFQLCAPEDVYRCGLSVEEALKMLVSLGIIAPDTLQLVPMSQALESPLLESAEVNEE
ncbi:MAG TPA: DUF502 domain-containing protein [Candidatus Hydrogenedentes bacterium]|nr:DUF502 domain-containing protein [Candidatus Hydrogenedentota bacterium]